MNNYYRIARGFRAGAADRFSHGFGKRGQLFDDSSNNLNNEYVISSHHWFQFCACGKCRSTCQLEHSQ